MFKVGDKVLFTWLNYGQGGVMGGLRTKIGMILSFDFDGYTVLHFDDYKTTVCKKINYDNICYIDDRDKVIGEIYNRYEHLLAEKKAQLKTVTQEEKDTEKLKLYNSVKQRILCNAERMLNYDLDDFEFQNRVKEIANLKKQLFTNKLSCVDEIHKYNGTIKYEYRQLETEMNKLINSISDEVISKAFNF